MENLNNKRFTISDLKNLSYNDELFQAICKEFDEQCVGVYDFFDGIVDKFIIDGVKDYKEYGLKSKEELAYNFQCLIAHTDGSSCDDICEDIDNFGNVSISSDVGKRITEICETDVCKSELIFEHNYEFVEEERDRNDYEAEEINYCLADDLEKYLFKIKIEYYGQPEPKLEEPKKVKEEPKEELPLKEAINSEKELTENQRSKFLDLIDKIIFSDTSIKEIKFGSLTGLVNNLLNSELEIEPTAISDEYKCHLMECIEWYLNAESEFKTTKKSYHMPSGVVVVLDA